MFSSEGNARILTANMHFIGVGQGLALTLCWAVLIWGTSKGCRSRVGISGTTSPTSEVHGEGKKSEEVKTSAILVVQRTTLLPDQRVSACGLHQCHHKTHHKKHPNDMEMKQNKIKRQPIAYIHIHISQWGTHTQMGRAHGHTASGQSYSQTGEVHQRGGIKARTEEVLTKMCPFNVASSKNTLQSLLYAINIYFLFHLFKGLLHTHLVWVFFLVCFVMTLMKPQAETCWSDNKVVLYQQMITDGVDANVCVA